MNPVLHSSDRMDWLTPENFLVLLRKMGPVALDPCSGPGSLVGAIKEYSPPQDGLALPWSCGGLVFVNSPYGREIREWVYKSAVEHLENGVEIVSLWPSRTDTSWWHEGIVGVASAVGFWRGRLVFVGAPASAPFPSAVIYYGKRVAEFRDAFGEACWIVS